MEWLLLVIITVVTGLGILLLEVGKAIWWKPLQMKKHIEAQGIQGPPYKLVYGNVPDVRRMAREQSTKPLPSSSSEHNIFLQVLPAFHQWRKTYGQNFVFWFGTKPRLYVHDPELVKEILVNKDGHYEKVPNKQLGYEGLVRLGGEKWAQHRRILNPAFHIELLKGMIPSFVEATTNMVREWTKLVPSGVNEIDILSEFSVLTSDIISRTAFGSSYAEGNHIFRLLKQRIFILTEAIHSVYIPGSRFLPSRKNWRRWCLEKEINRCMRQMIERRERSAAIKNSEDYGSDLLGLMMTSNKKQEGGIKMRMSMDEIISECLTFYIAGQETSATLLTWTMVLLGLHQDWQERARREVLQVCGKNDPPNADTVNGLKIVGMIINESLRLYPPVVALYRHANKQVKLGSFSLPAGTQFQLPILGLHHDPTLWGNDVHEFNPERFSQRISSSAKHAMSFFPFGFGPRICIGQNFALLEVKVALSMILQKFSFVISPDYLHSPHEEFTLSPQHGVNVILRMNEN